MHVQLIGLFQKYFFLFFSLFIYLVCQYNVRLMVLIFNQISSIQWNLTTMIRKINTLSVPQYWYHLSVPHTDKCYSSIFYEHEIVTGMTSNCLFQNYVVIYTAGHIRLFVFSRSLNAQLESVYFSYFYGLIL